MFSSLAGHVRPTRGITSLSNKGRTDAALLLIADPGETCPHWDQLPVSLSSLMLRHRTDGGFVFTASADRVGE